MSDEEARSSTSPAAYPGGEPTMMARGASPSPAVHSSQQQHHHHLPPVSPSPAPRDRLIYTAASPRSAASTASASSPRVFTLDAAPQHPHSQQGSHHSTHPHSHSHSHSHAHAAHTHPQTLVSPPPSVLVHPSFADQQPSDLALSSSSSSSQFRLSPHYQPGSAPGPASIIPRALPPRVPRQGHQGFHSHNPRAGNPPSRPTPPSRNAVLPDLHGSSTSLSTLSSIYGSSAAMNNLGSALQPRSLPLGDASSVSEDFDDHPQLLQQHQSSSTAHSRWRSALPSSRTPKQSEDLRSTCSSSSSSSSLSSAVAGQLQAPPLDDGSDSACTNDVGEGNNDDIVWVNQGERIEPLATPRKKSLSETALATSTPRRARRGTKEEGEEEGNANGTITTPPLRKASSASTQRASQSQSRRSSSAPLQRNSHADMMWSSVLQSLNINKNASHTNLDQSQHSESGAEARPVSHFGWERVRDQLVSSNSHHASFSMDPVNLESLRTLDIFIASWNMNKQDIPHDLSALLHPKGNLSHHMYIVGTQEGTVARRAWELKLRETLGAQYELAHSHALGVIQLCLFVRKDILPWVSNIESAHVATKMGGVMVTKGGVGICFDLGDTSFLFIDSHLAAHQNNIKDRNSDFRTICRNLGLPHKDRIKSEFAMTPLRSRSGV